MIECTTVTVEAPIDGEDPGNGGGGDGDDGDGDGFLDGIGKDKLMAGAGIAALGASILGGSGGDE